MENKKGFWAQYRLPISLIAGIAVGCIIGVVFGDKATVLKPLGDLFLNLMFCIVIPLVFVSISSAIGNMVNMKRLGKILIYLLTVFVVTGMIASVLVLFTVSIFPPAQGTNLVMQAGEMQKAGSMGKLIVDAISVNDFPALLSRTHMLALIIFSILFGFCVACNGGADSPVGRLLDNLSKIVMKMVDIIMLYAPIGLGAYFASLIGEVGASLIGDYSRALLIYFPLCALYFSIAFPCYAFFAGGMDGVKQMFKYILPPTTTSLATQSSIATLPVNLEAARNIGVPKDIREIVLPIGATMHMDGTVLSCILKISFLFGIFGMEFTGLGTLTTAVLIAILGGVVMSGVPGGGLVGEMLIVSIYGFPPEAFPIIATIGVLVDAPATCINATGDTIAAMIVTRLVEGKDWIKQALANNTEE